MNKPSITGTYIVSSLGGEKVKAFVPAKLPLKLPVSLEKLQPLLNKAVHLLGQLDSITSVLPDTALLIYFYVRKEALLSSQIEGTQSSFDDLLHYENKAEVSVPLADVEEVSHYVAALQHGLKRIKAGFPLSVRLIKEIHTILLRGGRGSTKQPGELRKSQNWIGGNRPGNALFVPPPPDLVVDLMSNLEFYLHDEFGKTPTLLKAAIAHVQFETIHPFLDGNGRVGRLLITVLLSAEGLLKEPVLYLSLYFKQHRQNYYDLLNRVRIEGVWEDWIQYFLEGIIEVTQEVIETTQSITQLFIKDKQNIATLKRARTSALKVFLYLQRKGIAKIPQLAAALKLSQPTVTAALKHLQNLKIVKEITHKQRDRLFVYESYVKILSKDAEPI